MSANEKSLSAAAREFVPTFGGAVPAISRSENIEDPNQSTTAESAAPPDQAADDGAAGRKKKKTKDERAAPRKRRHQRGRSGDVPPEFSTPSRSIKMQDKNLEEEVLFEPLSRRDSPSHHKSKSDGHILSWFDEMKQRRQARFREAPGLYGEIEGADGVTAAHHLSLVFSQPQEWVFGNNVTDQTSLEDAEYLAEKMERKKWQNWAQSAAEMERRRRIQVLQELDAEQEIERQRRRRWAIKAIEKEKAERISAQFLSSLSSTNWFNETITAYHEDYELVCPYYKLGCRVSCRRGNIEKHLKKCRFALEMIDEPLPEIIGGYEVVCPNSVLGCTYIGCLDALQEHLTECPYSGLTAQQEIEERLLLKQHVIRQQEEERARRVRFDDNVIVVKRPKSSDSTPDQSGVEGSPEEARDHVVHSSEEVSDSEGRLGPANADVDSSENSDGGGGRHRSLSRRKKALLQSLLEEQTKAVIRSLHKEAEAFYAAALEFRASRHDMKETTIDILRRAIHGLWSFADILPFGSHATGLSSLSSDLDLVVCFCDNYKSLPSVTGVVPLLQNLAECIQRQASDVFVIRKVLLHSAVPIIKADVLKSGLIARGLIVDGSNVPSSSNEYRSAPTPGTAAASRETAEVAWQKPSAENASNGSSSFVDDDIFLSVDISIDGPSHSGLATTEFVRSMLNVSPVLAPAVCVLKEFFKSKGLADPYTGGLSSYGIFLLVLLLYQRQNRLMFSSTATPSPKSMSSSPGRSMGRSFSFGDEDIASSNSRRSNPPLQTFASLDGYRREADEKSTSALRIRSLSTPDAHPVGGSDDDSKATGSGSKDTVGIALFSSRSPSRGTAADAAGGPFTSTSKKLFDEQPQPLESSPRSKMKVLAPPPRHLFSATTATSSSLFGASPPANVGNSGKTSSSFYPGSYGWKKVQQQMDYGSRVADKLLGVKQGSSKRRNSKTKISKFGSDFGSSDGSLTNGSSFFGGSNSTEKIADDVLDPLQNISRVNSGDFGPAEKYTAAEDTELGHLLLDFLEFYGEAWENEKVGFSVRDGGFKFDLVNSAGTPSHPQADDPFVIEDPVNVMNNVAKSCYNVAGVMRCIQEAYGKYRACIVKPGSDRSGLSPRVRSPHLHVDHSVRRSAEFSTSDTLPVLTEGDEDFEKREIADKMAEQGLNETTLQRRPPVPELTISDDQPVSSSNSSPVNKDEDSMKIFSSSSVRMNIRTRATNYMQQYVRGPTNSPVNPTKKLDPIQSIVSEIFDLPMVSVASVVSSSEDRSSLEHNNR